MKAREETQKQYELYQQNLHKNQGKKLKASKKKCLKTCTLI